MRIHLPSSLQLLQASQQPSTPFFNHRLFPLAAKAASQLLALVAASIAAAINLLLQSSHLLPSCCKHPSHNLLLLEIHHILHKASPSINSNLFLPSKL
ncbi:hypothetical protein Pyn_02940 [Prunus yedoensis var. nudiflora]|uniref:Uncharacterized protein n=1 Tax=Prunus yedoensis var. nudiflora TaxID=2094558 RepID=A0A314UP17_PRUYE|nr:hypothetical protein Pyn_02940 [Prunus yedoensis var. nudiflora]